MRSASAATLIFSCVASIASAAPFAFSNDPLNNGFPKASPDQINQIELLAHGSLPTPAKPAANAPPAKPVSSDTLTSLRFIAFNENFEAAFFTSLINNITSNQAGFTFKNGTAKQDLVNDLTAVLAQEELHAINANNALTANKQKTIDPCQYVFPTNNTEDAIALASKFTDIVLATLPDIQTGFATNNDSSLIRGVGAGKQHYFSVTTTLRLTSSLVIGQEGEQNGFYREFIKKSKKIPSALPFLTAGTRNFAFSALNQNFVVPGSCGDSLTEITNDPNIHIFAPLVVETDGGNLQPKNQNVKFSFLTTGVKTVNDLSPKWKGPNNDWSGLSLVYINQQNAPVVEKLASVNPLVGSDGVTLEFEANFPFNGTTFGNGLTLAAVVPADTVDLSTVVAVSDATLAGPGLIEVN